MNPTDGEDRARHQGHPRRLPHVRQFAVRDELILVAPERTEDVLDGLADNRALAINETGRAIWELCDGSRTPDDIVSVLEPQFEIDSSVLVEHVSQTLMDFTRLGLLEGLVEHSRARMPTTFVIGIEDKPYFWWQAAIWLESFRGKLPRGWETYVVVCNDAGPISPELRSILASYDTRFAQSTNHARTNLIDIGHEGGQCYSAGNKIEALSVVADTIDPAGMICLLDSDIFLYGELQLDIMPAQCAMARNWHVEKELFLSSVDKNDGKGIDLQKLLDALGCQQQFQPGGVNVFVTGEVARNEKFIADCFRFAHAIFLLGRAAGADAAWMAEMPCYALAMAANGIAFELLEHKQFLVSDCNEETIPPGTLYHYYSDPKDFGRAAFSGSRWHKQAYFDQDFLRTDFQDFATTATTDHEKYFFHLAAIARKRLDV